MLELGGTSEFLAAIGAVAGGGIVLGSLLGAAFALTRQVDRPGVLEQAGGGGLIGALMTLAIFAIEQAGGL